ncbi:hypothetical protein [Consotaella salsifontis]|uniref:DUF2336 domain-containing protein n=1 Tax=Consotaella salsifontis TaxID=1365950 RepID=A0A1T4MFB5_9HYPH|nr:hypothetical protein [Consotaella salsifontis]SJZ65719.1 hypothetical protein SAMN05428963_102100 [Consotaella salsifontis]
MKDAAPRIFRDLEYARGSGGLDAAVSAAVATYAALRAPSERQAEDLNRLVMAAWEKLSSDTRRATAAALSRSPLVPRALVKAFLAAPIEVAAPFLVASPTLKADDLAALAARGETGIDRLLRQRQALRSAEASPSPQPAPPAKPTQQGDPEVAPRAENETTPQDFARPKLQAPPLAPELVPEAPPVAVPPPTTGAAQARRTLERLVMRGLPGVRGRTEPFSAGMMIELAMDGHFETCYRRLGEALDADPSMMALVEEDEQGERLAVALKALGTTPAEAMSILVLLKPRIGRTAKTFAQMETFYRALSRDDCRRLVAGPAARRTGYQAQVEDAARPSHGAPRPAFGRRRIAPQQKPGTGTGRA